MITENGYKIETEEEWFNNIKNAFKTQFPQMSENPENLLIVLSRIMAKNESERDYDIAQRYSYAYVATATGMHLDKAVRTAGIRRNRGTKAYGTMTLTKSPTVPSVSLPSNFIIKSGDYEYRTTSGALVITDPTVEIGIEAVLVGADYNLVAGSTFTSVQYINGIESMVTASGIAGGTDMETDPVLRQRYYERMNGYVNASLKGVIDSVKTVVGVLRVDGTENTTDTIDADGQAPHSVSIYVEGGVDQEVANKLMDSKPAGIYTNGDVVVDVSVSGRVHQVRFFRFGSVQVYYIVDIVTDPLYVKPDISTRVIEELINYTASNVEIIAYELSAHLAQFFGNEVIGVRKLLFGLTENPTTSDDLIAGVGESFGTASDKITLTVV